MIQFTASGLIKNSYNQFLFVLHKKSGKWIPPGGKVEPNELQHQACIREVEEETGITVEIIEDKLDIKGESGTIEIPKPFVIRQWQDNDIIFVDSMYLCKYIRGDVKLQISEIEDYKWLTYEDIKDLDTFDCIKDICRIAYE